MSPEIKHWREQVIALSALKMRYQRLCSDARARSSDIAALLVQMEQVRDSCPPGRTGRPRP